MSAVEPLFTHQAATDVLKNLFSPPSKEAANEAGSSSAPHLEPPEGIFARAKQKAATVAAAPTAVEFETSDQDLLQAEAKEISAEPNDNVHVDHFFTQTEQGEEPINLTKSDLVRVLETFVSVLMESKESHSGDTGGAHINLPSPIPFEPSQHALAQVNEIIDAKNAEIDDLKSMLVEAQSTIITLLTDRVEDKAKIATFETQMRYLPDYQRLHTPPGEIQPVPSEELKADLTKVKAEIQSIKMAAYKEGLENNQKWSIKAWLSKLVG